MKLFRGFMVITLFLVLYSIVGTIESTDRVQCQVIDNIDGNTYVEDSQGNIFSFDGEDFSEGQWVEVTFFNGGDCNPRNDKIVKIVEIH